MLISVSFRMINKRIFLIQLFFVESSKPPTGEPISCAEATTFCHVYSKCLEYEEGVCCQCKQNYYGNGKYCVKKGKKYNSK